METYYRFGELPTDGISSVWEGNKCIGEEKGISVYEAHLNVDGRYVPVPPFPLTEQVLNDYVYHTRYFRGRKYLVRGDLLGTTGSNGEPLLQNVEIIKELE